MNQTIALVIDAYRDLNARKLFWITLLISAALIVILAMFGMEPGSLSFLKWHFDVFQPELWYDGVILNFFVFGVWLSWAALVLALISTGGMFPDLIAGGAIDLYLSKPIGRFRLFLTKYLTGLFFVAIQLIIFCVGCYFVVGWRAHEWRPGLFLAIPLVTAMYSYVFGICVLLGVWWRSSIAAILVSILLWLVFSGIARIDSFFATWDRAINLTVLHANQDIAYIDAQKPSNRLFDISTGLLHKRRQADLDAIEETTHYHWVRVVHAIGSAVHAVIPKTGETDDLLDKYLMTDAELETTRSGESLPPPSLGVNPRDLQQASRQQQDAVRHASPWYVVGTSLGFEVVVVGLAAWIFCRRGY